MDMLNRIKSTVSNLSNVLPGNPVTREYEVTEHIASAGPALLWKVYKGIKKSTKEEASVFVFEKKLLEKYPKHERDAILCIVKKGIANLTRLRHPSILTVQHSLEESRESLAFATEPVFASLANIMGFNENMPVPPPKMLKDFELYDIEIKYGILQLTEGLTFLHNDVKMTHGNLNPRSVIVNRNGAWKLSGFDFCSIVSNTSQGENQILNEIEIKRPSPCFPDLDYVAPEYLNGAPPSPLSDMYSLGVLLFACHNKGKPVFAQRGNSLSEMKKHLHTFHQSLTNSRLLKGKVPPESEHHLQHILTGAPELRSDAFQTLKSPLFDDVGVKTLQYLDSLYQWDNFQKSQFFKGLPQIISQMPQRVKLLRVLPCLAKEYLTPEMVPFVLPNVLLIAEEASKEEFQAHILQEMIPLFSLQEPIQITLIFMQKMELLLSKCPRPVISNHVLPMIHRALESDAQQIQELCLSIIPKFASLIEYSAMKNALLPRIKKLCVNTSYLSVRVNCLVCLGKLLEHLDKWLVLDEVLPFLSQIPSKEPAVLMGILGILKLTMSHKKLGITKEVLATKTIPFLMPLSIENGLTLSQFNAIMSVVRQMINYVEAEHKSKLEQLNAIRQEHGSTVEMTHADKILLPEFSKDDTKNHVDDMFNELGVSSFSKPHFKKEGDSNTSSNSMPSSTVFPKPMNMMEKRSPTWAQNQKLNANNFEPRPPTAPKTTRNDATSSLINSNLNSLSTMKISNDFNQPMPQKSNLTYWPQTYPTEPQFPNPASFTSMMPNPVSQSQHFPYQRLPISSPPSMDLRSLDSLLPIMGSRQPLTLAQIGGVPRSPGVQPPMVTSPPQYRVPSSSSSSAKSELDDLLG